MQTPSPALRHKLTNRLKIAVVGIAKRWLQFALWKRTLVGLLVGCLLGLSWPAAGIALEPLGELFIRAIKMLVVPLVFSTIVSGIVAMGDVSKIGNIGIRVLLFYLVTTAVAIVIGLGTAECLPPLAQLGVEAEAVETSATESPPFLERLIELVPTNPFQSLAEGDIFQIILFAILFGGSILLVGKQAEVVGDVFTACAEIMLKMTLLVMELAPFGVLALIASTVSKHGAEAIGSLLALVAVFYIACILHVVVTYGAILSFVLRLKPLNFFRGIIDAQMVAFSTTSSSATLPATLTCVQKNLGVDRSSASFVLPLGATLNMDGTGIYLGVTTVFAAQLAGVTLTFGDCLELIFVATLASIGIAGVPGGSLVMLSTVLVTVGLPLEVFALVAGVDRVLDMARTTVNVTGDALAGVYISKSLKDFDERIYNASPG